MINIEAIEKISKKYSNAPDDFIRRGSTLAIKERKTNLQMERLDILSNEKAAHSNGKFDSAEDIRQIRKERISKL